MFSRHEDKMLALTEIYVHPKNYLQMKKRKELLVTVRTKVLCVKIFFSLVLLVTERFFWSFLKKKERVSNIPNQKKMKGHEKDQPTHSPCNAKVQVAIPKKNRERMLHFQTIKEMKLHKKIKPPTHFTMSKSRLKSKAVPKKKKEREH
jgi:hypothetical protein